MTDPLNGQGLDKESTSVLAQIAEYEKILSQRFPGVRTVLVVLSARGLVFDIEAMRQKIHLAYNDAAVFFANTQGGSTGAECPAHVDLLIDLTGPEQRQSLFLAKKLRRMARVAVGRNAGWFRKQIYDLVCDETLSTSSFRDESYEDSFSRECRIQKMVLALAGVPFAQMGEALPDLGKSIALELPLLKEF
ncbi:hypothetical protein WDW86_18800 [Bdellovibrionota bacterium FG-2]